MTKRRDLISELQTERSNAIDLLYRADLRFERLSTNGYLNDDDKRLWEDIREYLRDTP